MIASSRTVYVLMDCPLCTYQADTFESLAGRRNEYFLRCPRCLLIFRPVSDHVSHEAEENRYLTHNNSLENRGYVDFLLKPFDFAEDYLHPQETILDFGCGYNPVFAKLMRQKGWPCDYYDPYFFPAGIRRNKYANIFCLETVEHFNKPLREWKKLQLLLASGGVLIVMTDLWNDITLFPNWHYIKDETHVSFYHMDTLQWIADQFDWEILDADESRITIFRA